MQIITPDSIDTAPIEEKRATLIQAAHEMEITTPAEVAQADEVLVALATGIANIKAELKPMRDSTTAAWKAGTELENKLVGPLEAAKKALAQKRGAAVRAIEDAKRTAAEAASDALDKGDVDGASALMEVATQEVQKSAVSSRSVWSAEVVDIDALIEAAHKDKALRAYLLPNLPALNSAVKATKERTNIPGVKAVENFTSTARTAAPKQWRDNFPYKGKV